MVKKLLLGNAGLVIDWKRLDLRFKEINESLLPSVESTRTGYGSGLQSKRKKIRIESHVVFMDVIPMVISLWNYNGNHSPLKKPLKMWSSKIFYPNGILALLEHKDLSY